MNYFCMTCTYVVSGSTGKIEEMAPVRFMYAQVYRYLPGAECDETSGNIWRVKRRERQREREIIEEGGMTRGKQKIDAQRRNAERNQKAKGSQLEARQVGLKSSCPICKVQLANEKQLVDHYASKHPKEKPPSEAGCD
ncbi:hypothetical protein ACMD2_02483 [Ananas comosus]|uniref:C2H2-type domain-containing protein n=1 Tax=Ananas comosus TaxID=4615 RepID=A0A199V8X2_ANACO|nr:hypothetical protein ACMD2_02483 [Ananas comosus]